MRKGQYLFIVILTSVLAGCAGIQEPAPVFGGGYPTEPEIITQQPQDNTNQPASPPPPVTETRPLEGMNKSPELIEIKPDLPPPLPPQTTAPPTSPGATNGNNAQPPLIDPGADMPQGQNGGVPNSDEPQVAEQPITGDSSAEQIVPPVAETPKAPEQFTPLETFAQQSPAVGSLVIAANENTQAGNYDSAAASIERAIRIEPRNAALYYKLAVLRLNQSKPRLAEDIARKAALLAADDNNLRKHSWLLIANARQLQNNFAGAQKAKAEAAKY